MQFLFLSYPAIVDYLPFIVAETCKTVYYTLLSSLAQPLETYYHWVEREHSVKKMTNTLHKGDIYAMIFENTGLVGLQSDLQYLDESAEKAGFIRWQWEYYRATYDCKIEDKQNGDEYFLRFNTRVIEGKLEKPDAVLAIEAVYLGRGTFPHGLDYESPVPQPVLDIAGKRIADLIQLLWA